ncbi:reticulon-like protein B9 [Pistacia vera]|uniref:reticulon-like protein B9 n=1 Tax=Pistacia vera TaxID=55513 RepID=UPI0012639593|nr:reticulon-like protein B9 [Pistacia vera]
MTFFDPNSFPPTELNEVYFLREEITESAALLIGMTVIWFLVEVMEYNFVGLLCHISISLILIIYIRIWLITSFYWDPLNILGITYFEARFRELIAHIFCSRFDFVLGNFLRIAYGQNPTLLILVFSASKHCIFWASDTGNNNLNPN